MGGGEIAHSHCPSLESHGSMLYDRNEFLSIGGFEELFAPLGWEDVEICVRAWKQGFVMHYEPQSAVWHQFSSTIGPRFDQRRVQAIYERNRLWVHWMHLDTPGAFHGACRHGARETACGFVCVALGHLERFRPALRGLSRVRARRKKLFERQKLQLADVLESIAEGRRRRELRAYGEDVALVCACPYSPRARLIVPTPD